MFGQKSRGDPAQSPPIFGHIPNSHPAKSVYYNCHLGKGTFFKLSPPQTRFFPFVICLKPQVLPHESTLSISVAEAYFDDSGLPAPCPGPSPHVSKMSTIYFLKTRTFRCLLPSSHVYLLKGTLHRRVQLDEYPPGKTFDAQVDQCSASMQHAI